MDYIFEEMTDEQLVKTAQEGPAADAAMEYLLNKYKNFVRTKARSYFLIGADHEDIVQEGMIGLYKAIRDYRRDKLKSSRSMSTSSGLLGASSVITSRSVRSDSSS